MTSASGHTLRHFRQTSLWSGILVVQWLANGRPCAFLFDNVLFSLRAGPLQECSYIRDREISIFVLPEQRDEVRTAYLSVRTDRMW